MKNLTKCLLIYVLILLQSANAKTVCSMTFNSADEKQVFKKYLTGYEHIELVPSNKDPKWFSKACSRVKACDVLVVSGHFGGLFFGEQSSMTISIDELVAARDNSLCPAILDKPKSVFLMGCNTMASKLPDHRSVNDYLRVLTGDGFPLNLAENVAASRYLNFGQSMGEVMSTIFNKSELLVGFDSTGPLGAQAAPKLAKAFELTSVEDRNKTGISRNAILKSFSGTNLRAIKPELSKIDLIRQYALSQNEVSSEQAWKAILTGDKILKYFDFLITHQNNPVLAKIIENDKVSAKNVRNRMLLIYQMARGLTAIQVRTLEFLKKFNLINYYEFEDAILMITSSLLSKKIDYISADQFCSILKGHQKLNILEKISSKEKATLNNSSYASLLKSCAGTYERKTKWSKAYECLMNQTTYDWACLTENSNDLDLPACELAKFRNPDPENADDMLWFCYYSLNASKKLKQPSCLELTHSFSMLGNQIKMNWNCLNRVSE